MLAALPRFSSLDRCALSRSLFLILVVFICHLLSLPQIWILRRLCCISQHVEVSFRLHTSCCSKLGQEEPFVWPTGKATPRPPLRNYEGTNASMSSSQSKRLYYSQNIQFRFTWTSRVIWLCLKKIYLSKLSSHCVTVTLALRFSEHCPLLCTNSSMSIYQRADGVVPPSFIAMLFVCCPHRTIEVFKEHHHQATQQPSLALSAAVR